MKDEITITECVERLDVIRNEIVPKSRDYFALSAGIAALYEIEKNGAQECDDSDVRLIDANSLEPDTEWDEYCDGFLSYSQAQIDAAPTIEVHDHTEVSNMNDLIRREDALHLISSLLPANHWVSTEDRFPDDGSRVLTCDSVGWVDIGVYNGRRGWEINGNYLPAEMIKRWQPLPTGERSV